jgi:hypothetical protein
MLNPNYPVVEGPHQITDDWSIVLPRPFNRRIEDGELCIWRPGFTVWVVAWNNDDDESAAERLDWLRETSSPGAFDVIDEQSNDLVRFAYRLEEPSDDKRVAALYCFVIGRAGHLQLAMYFDREADVELGLGIWRSAAESPP